MKGSIFNLETKALNFVQPESYLKKCVDLSVKEEKATHFDIKQAPNNFSLPTHRRESIEPQHYYTKGRFGMSQKFKETAKSIPINDQNKH